MPKKEVPFAFLKNFLPEGTLSLVDTLLQTYRVHLTITRERKTLLGDYKHRVGQHHQISVNGNLNPFAFLLTLLHELAHLITFEKYGHRVQAHGAEWKFQYGQLLGAFLEKKLLNIFFIHNAHDVITSSISVFLCKLLSFLLIKRCGFLESFLILIFPLWQVYKWLSEPDPPSYEPL